MYTYFSDNKNNTNKTTEMEMKNDFLNEENTIILTEETNDTDYTNYILQLVEEAILDGDKNIRYYENLSKLAKDQKDKSILRNIHLDEMKHKNIFLEVYKILTDSEPSLTDKYQEDIVESSFLDELVKKVEQSLESANFFRILLSMFGDLSIRDLIFEAIVNKQSHAQLLNNMYMRNK